jgi:hypothetical protein
MGAKVKAGRSAVSGIVSSFVINLTTSANGWNSPNGPHRFGPSLTWNLPNNRRSNHVYKAVAMTKVLTTAKASNEPASANAIHAGKPDIPKNP